MKTIWIIILLFVLISSIWRRMERAGSAGRYGEPAGISSPEVEGTFPGKTYGEQGRKLNLPGYITGRDSEPAVPERKGEPGTCQGTIAAARNPLETEQPEPGEINFELPYRPPPAGHLTVQTLAVVPRGYPKGQPLENFLIDIPSPGLVLQGIVWSEILGPRGGKQAKRKK